MFSFCEPFQNMRISLFASQMVLKWRRLGEFAWNREKIHQQLHWIQKTLFWWVFPPRLTKMSNMRAATAQNINNMNMGPILRHTTLFPPHPGIECSPWKRVNSANISLQNLYYEISCYFRNGQNFHISTYSYHSVPLPKFTLGYRLQLLITFLTIFKRYIGIFWKIRKALSNPNLPLKQLLFDIENACL